MRRALLGAVLLLVLPISAAAQGGDGSLRGTVRDEQGGARTGANRIYNPQNFLTYTNPQTPRALQLEAIFRF